MKSIGMVALAAILTVGASTVAQARPDVGSLSQLNSVRSSDSLAMEPARMGRFVETIVSEPPTSFVGTPVMVSQMVICDFSIVSSQWNHRAFCGGYYDSGTGRIFTDPNNRHVPPAPDAGGGYFRHPSGAGLGGCMIFPYGGFVGAFCD